MVCSSEAAIHIIVVDILFAFRFLEADSPYLLDLHSWFNLWAMRKNVHVLTMTEQRVTPVNRHCSILLVPEDIRGMFSTLIAHIVLCLALTLT